VFPLATMVGITVFSIGATYANDRFRASAETALLILAAVALDAIGRARVRLPMQSDVAASQKSWIRGRARWIDRHARSRTAGAS
jgi:hypothetical protein